MSYEDTTAEPAISDVKTYAVGQDGQLTEVATPTDMVPVVIATPVEAESINSEVVAQSEPV